MDKDSENICAKVPMHAERERVYVIGSLVIALLLSLGLNDLY